MTSLFPTNPLSGASSLTPGRKTVALFDRTEAVITDGATGGTRSNVQIAPVAALDKGADSKFSRNLYLWSSGCYTLRPLQMDINKVREVELPEAVNNQFVYTTGASTPVEAMTIATIDLLSYNTWKEPIGEGLAVTPARNTKGDVFYRKQVLANGTFAQSVAAPVDVTSFEAALVAKRYASSITQPLDPILAATFDQPADQGWCLRWDVPGNSSDSYDVIGTFHFGGGQYALAIHGNGDATLWEWGKATIGGAFAWDQVKSFKYCNPSRVSGFTHELIIFPVVGPHGEKLLHFYGAELENNEGGADASGAPGSLTIGFSSSAKETVYQWSPALTGKLDGSPGHAVKAGAMYFQVRRDIRILFQISRLIFPTSGTLTDQPWEVPTASTVRTFTVTPTATVPTGTDIDILVRDADTLSSVSVVKPFVRFTFTSDGFNTPRFWKYQLRRAALLNVSAPGSFETQIHGNIELQDGGGDARGAMGSISIHDPRGQFPRLRRRGFLPVTLYTYFQPTDGGDVQKVSLFRGYAIRPYWTKRGRSGSSFPNWHEYALPLTGMWYRLTRPPTRGLITWKDFAVDPLSANGDPYKVTTAIRVLLDLAGFPTGQVNIPDNPTRLFPGIGTEPSDLLFDGATSLAEMISRLLSNYLGAALYFDDNAGDLDTDGLPIGQWTVLFPPAGDPASGFPDSDPPTPVLNFVTTGPTQGGGGYRHPGFLGSYPANTVPCFGPQSGTNVPPEGNHAWVITAPDVLKTGGIKIANHGYNSKSYQVPGWTAAPDPEGPQYLGMEQPVIVPDPTLWGGDDLKDTQKAVDFMLRRVFNYACLAREIEHKHGPLVFVQDDVTGRWRKPRYYDPVTINGEAGWYIRSVNISYRYDRLQMATYELERTVPIG